MRTIVHYIVTGRNIDGLNRDSNSGPLNLQSGSLLTELYLAPIFQQVDRHILPPLNDFRPRKLPPAGSFILSVPVDGHETGLIYIYLLKKE